MSRPTKLNPITQKAIIDALAIGATYRDAAEAAGVWYETFNRWMILGSEAKSGIYYQFNNAVRQAESSARLKYTSVIAQAAKDGDWRAAEAFLKRRDRANWGDSTDVTSGGESFIVRLVKHEES